MSDSNEADLGEDGAGGTDGGRRSQPDRSTISFPYTHLEDAITVATAINEAGVALSRAQIAGVLNADPSSGGFSLRVGAARTFRLIEPVDGKYALTEIGARILSPDDPVARAARREAFLSVELYHKTFEAFRNRPLPPRPTGLENAFQSYGVAPKQKDKARLAFERSAQFAGFFHAGKERLVEPIIAAAPQNGRVVSEAPVMAPVAEPRLANPLPVAAQQPLIRGLLDRLPAPEQKWGVPERARWLRVLSANLAMIYGDDDEGEITIAFPKISPPSKAVELIAQTTAARGSDRNKSTAWDAPKSDLDDDIPF